MADTADTASRGDRESVPLITGLARNARQAWRRGEQLWSQFAHRNDEDVMKYRATKLSLWSTCLDKRGAIFGSSTLWWTMAKLIFLTFLVAALTNIIVVDPVSLDLQKFREIGSFLNVFVGLMLGFFLSSSINRWYSCVGGFLELMDAVRNLHMQLTALGVQDPKAELCIRYGFLSAWLLFVQFSVEALPIADQDAAMTSAWDFLDSVKGVQQINDKLGITSHEPFTTVTPYERQVLEACEDPAGTVWTWVGSLVGRMAQDGLIPPMPSPTYGRIMDLAQDAHGGLRNIRASILVQAPYVYSHLLATLVHVSNIINAISLGLTLGTTVGVLLLRFGISHHGPQPRPRMKDVRNDMQDVVINSFMSMVGPLLYQSILELCINIAQPFDGRLAKIPSDRLLSTLAQDLRDAKRVAQDVPSWDKPCYGATVARGP